VAGFNKFLRIFSVSSLAVSKLVLFNKPFRVLSQFSPSENKTTLAEFIPIKQIYPAGRLDYDSEGLLLLTDDGKLQAQLSNPRFHQSKIYLAQVEGVPDQNAVHQLARGDLKGWEDSSGKG
jgi:23S rRNA pseudouridine2457 synthase